MTIRGGAFTEKNKKQLSKHQNRQRCINGLEIYYANLFKNKLLHKVYINSGGMHYIRIQKKKDE